MKNIYIIRQMIVSFIVFLILIWSFFKNQIFGKIIISPFLICSIALFFKNLFILLNSKKISDIFKYIFRISLFVYFFGFLIYSLYFAFSTKSYSQLIIIGIFFIISINFFKQAFPKNMFIVTIIIVVILTIIGFIYLNFNDKKDKNNYSKEINNNTKKIQISSQFEFKIKELNGNKKYTYMDKTYLL